MSFKHFLISKFFPKKYILKLLIIILCVIHIYSLNENIYFLIESPEKLNYIYQINPSYHIGASFPKHTIKDIGLVYANPSDGCQEFENSEYIKGEVVLIERGDCPFVNKILNAQKAGAKIAIITNSAEGSDEFIEMIMDNTSRKAEIPAAYLPGINGKRIREYLLYEKPILWIQIPLNYTTTYVDNIHSKPPWELWYGDSFK